MKMVNAAVAGSRTDAQYFDCDHEKVMYNIHIPAYCLVCSRMQIIRDSMAKRR